MALTDGVDATQKAIITAIYDSLESTTRYNLGTYFEPDEVDEKITAEVKSGWQALGAAVAEALAPICEHFIAHAEIGIVTTEVDLAAKTGKQDNTGTGLIK